MFILCVMTRYRSENLAQVMMLSCHVITESRSHESDEQVMVATVVIIIKQWTLLLLFSDFSVFYRVTSL